MAVIVHPLLPKHTPDHLISTSWQTGGPCLWCMAISHFPGFGKRFLFLYPSKPQALFCLEPSVQMQTWVKTKGFTEGTRIGSRELGWGRDVWKLSGSMETVCIEPLHSAPAVDLHSLADSTGVQHIPITDIPNTMFCVRGLTKDRESV